jgi:hypothetical protein
VKIVKHIVSGCDGEFRRRIWKQVVCYSNIASANFEEIRLVWNGDLQVYAHA